MQDLLDKPIGRLKFLSYAFIANFCFVLLVDILAYTNALTNGLWMVFLALNATIVSIIVKKRLIDIGFAWPDPASRLFFVVSMALGIWAYNATINGDARQEIYSSVVSLLISLPVFIYLLFWPSNQVQALKKEKHSFKAEKKRLQQEKKALLEQQEIESLKREITDLKSRSPEN